MRMWWTKREPDRRQQIGERLAEIFMQSTWTAELRAEAEVLRNELLRDELLSLDEVPPAAELSAPPPRRAVGDSAAEAQRAVERERAAEAQRWRRVLAMRRGGMSAVIWDPERSAQRAAARRQQREHTSGLVRDSFRLWR